MVDTIRTENDLLTALFQDGQAAGSITAQDVRDLIVSLRPAHAEIYVQANATATTVSATSTFYKVAGTTALTSGNYLIDNASTSNRLRYTGAAEKTVMVQATFSFDAASNNQVLVFAFYRYDDSASSGAIVNPSQITMDYHGEQINGTIQMLVTLDTNDYVELHVANNTATVNVTVKDLNMQALGFIQ